jgi:hypothetical protein
VAGAQQQFTAIVQGTNNTAVNWSVDTIASGNAMVGTMGAVGFVHGAFDFSSPRDHGNEWWSNELEI